MSTLTDSHKPMIEELTSLLSNGEYGRAEKLISESFAQPEKKAMLFYWNSQLELAKKNIVKALEFANTAFSINNSDINIALLFAKLLTEDGQTKKSLELYYQINKAFPNNLPALRGMERIFLSEGEYFKVFYVYRSLQQQGVLDESDIGNLEYSLSKLKVVSINHELEQEIIALIEDKRIDVSKIHGFVASFLIQKYQLGKDNYELDLIKVATDKLFEIFLRRTVIREPILDSTCVKLRKTILEKFIETNHLSDSEYRLCSTLARNNWLNEYIQPVSDSEQKETTEMRHQLLSEISSFTKSNSINQLIILAMYQSIAKHPFSQLISNIENSKLPGELQWVVELALKIQREDALSKDLESLTSSDDEISSKVKQMYEQNPYPRWSHCSLISQTNISELIVRETGHDGCQFSNSLVTPRILIAGCGTGRELIRYSNAFTGAKVIAVDISYRSIAYAKLKAQEHNLDNVEFFHADILGLIDVKEKFDVIFCSGVLHHLSDPIKGWNNLTNLLKPRGLMRIALYSKAGREFINRVRHYVHEKQYLPEVRNIRKIRQLVFDGKFFDNKDNLFDGSKNGFTGSVTGDLGDFCTLSNCRDLVFHVQESQYSIEDLQQMMNELSLSFLGFSIDLSITKEFPSIFSHPSEQFILSNWIEFERLMPTAFKHMYQFWCQLD